VPPLSDEERERLREEGIRAIERSGTDPNAPAGGVTMEDRYTVTIQEYSRVEPFSSVLTLAIVLGTSSAPSPLSQRASRPVQGDPLEVVALRAC
jgi:hypothetical protein